ncbi:protein kinase [Stieleria sp. JC731]|uniref:serine/threonine protein kinase n=1 Tax=Pirellulaceae TaxID=2691357 RepID=UPI001E640AA4|nr:serine/threonine-protein kinase [Stieleria sp. JC731]MCC9601163.1 protein kinase [Stieleria sp. JC731]
MSGSATKHDFLDPPKNGADDLGTLGHYRVIRELGKGGMGYVFLAEDSKLKRQVALKTMNQKIAATPGSRKRFISEARTMAAVHHDNVATIFEVGEHKGTPFMAMELLQGSTLEDYREQHGEPDFHTIIGFARDMARGLAAAHERGIVHRDIKPANIWLDAQTNRIKILDFGLALAQTPVDQLSGRGAVVGTPGYLSPEQARSEPLDDRSDLYSTGVVLYELATGKLPLKSKTVAEQLIAILAHQPVPVRERNDKIPQPLADLIEKLMAKEPRDRYDTAKDLETCLVEVEKECESKSEVAQAISQLQAGLDLAVNKKQPSQDTFAESTPNPFESLPENLPPAQTPTVQSPSASEPAAFGSAAAPFASPPGTATAAATKPKPTASSVSTSKVVLIAVAVVAVLLLAVIPLVVYLSASSAIARQQNNTVVTGGDPNSNATPAGPNSSSDYTSISKPESQSTPAKGTTKPKSSSATANNSTAKKAPSNAAAKNNNRSSQPKPSTPFAALSLRQISSSETKNLGGNKVRYLLNEKNGNGSFESGKPNSDKKIPGWSLQLVGDSGGWLKTSTAREIDGPTHAFAGKKSEVILTSDPSNYRVKAGDVFRIGLHVGGEGKGPSDFLVAIGFKDSNGKTTTYEIARPSLGNAWSAAQPKRLRYEVTALPDVVGQQPFIQIGISNLNRTRDIAVADRVIMTVQPTAEATIASNQPTPNQPASRPTTSAPQPAPTPQANRSAKNQESDNATEKQDTNLRIVTLSTNDDLGADATVRRGGAQSDTLGEKSSLIIQTRNDRQIQHIYLRFPMTEFRGQTNQNRPRQQKKQSLPIKRAAIRVQLSEPAEQDTTVQLYGIDDPVSDLWPENKIVWSNSFSSTGLEKLPKLGEAKIDKQTRELVLSNPKLAKFLADSQHDTVTFVLTGSSGNELVTFSSKENTESKPPTLVIGLQQ